MTTEVRVVKSCDPGLLGNRDDGGTSVPVQGHGVQRVLLSGRAFNELFVLRTLVADVSFVKVPEDNNQAVRVDLLHTPYLVEFKILVQVPGTLGWFRLFCKRWAPGPLRAHRQPSVCFLSP
ncbi:uncharacterized protein ACO6RY_04599 [Pungitius sinensis]